MHGTGGGRRPKCDSPNCERRKRRWQLRRTGKLRGSVNPSGLAPNAHEFDRDRTLTAMHGLESALGSAAPKREGRWRDGVLEALGILHEAIQEVDFADLRQRLGWILHGLRHQGGRESDLIFEAYYEAFGIDLGQESRGPQA